MSVPEMQEEYQFGFHDDIEPVLRRVKVCQKKSFAKSPAQKENQNGCWISV